MTINKMLNLNEAGDADLFHATSLSQVINILKNDKLNFGKEMVNKHLNGTVYNKDGLISYISFARIPGRYEGGSVLISIDAKKLQAEHKLRPYAWISKSRTEKGDTKSGDYRKYGKDETEERLHPNKVEQKMSKPGIRNFKSMIKMITFKVSHAEVDELKNADKKIEELKALCKKNNIKLSMKGVNKKYRQSKQRFERIPDGKGGYKDGPERISGIHKFDKENPKKGDKLIKTSFDSTFTDMTKTKIREKQEKQRLKKKILRIKNSSK